jgi:hypothetical protein
MLEITNLAEFKRDLRQVGREVDNEIKHTLREIRDDWIMRSRDVAPLDTGYLRKQIEGRINDTKLIVTGNATNNTRSGSFNYGYWLHEAAPPSTSLRMPGTTLKFLDEPAKERENAWMRMVEQRTQAVARRRGF